MLPRIILNTDGGSRRNPGPAGIGAVVSDAEGRTLAQLSEYIGTATNNEAEYQALINGLDLCRRTVEAKKVYLLVHLDSELVARQVEGVYKVKEERLKPLVRQVRSLLTAFAAWRVESVPRERNKLADQLVNQAIDRELESRTAAATKGEPATPPPITAAPAGPVSPASPPVPDPSHRRRVAPPDGQLSFADLGLLGNNGEASAAPAAAPKGVAANPRRAPQDGRNR